MALHLRYTWARFMSAALPAAEDVIAGRAAVLDAAKAAAERFSSARLTTLVRLGGQAMAPTLNAGLLPNSAGETLLVRSFTAPSERCARASPRLRAMAAAVMSRWLRRLLQQTARCFEATLSRSATRSRRRPARCSCAALLRCRATRWCRTRRATRPLCAWLRRRTRGAPLGFVAADSAAAARSLPPGTCWVERDNEEVPLEQAPDSRLFGPLPLRALSGRVLYAARGRSDHGGVRNSDEAAAEDAAVLAHELDLEALADAAGR